MMKFSRKLYVDLLMCSILIFNNILGVSNVFATNYKQNVIIDVTDKNEKELNNKVDEIALPQKNALNDSRLFNYIDEKEFMSNDYSERIIEKEDLNTYVFQHSDGKESVYILDENVKYYDENGNIIEKDLSLVNKGDGYITKANDIDIFLPYDIIDGITIKYEDINIKMVPDCSNNTNGTIIDNSVVYENVFKNGGKLKYIPELSGLKEEIIIDHYNSDNIFSFKLFTRNLNLIKKDNICYLRDEKNNINVLLSEVIIFDNNGKLGTGNISIEEEEKNIYLIKIVADESFLKDPTTSYPVVIDPSITISDNTHGSNAIIDAPIYQGHPNNNYGNNIYNGVGTIDNNYQVGRTVVRLSGLINLPVLSNLYAANIDNVRFYVKEATGTQSQYINLYPLQNASWTESGVTWNNVGTYLTSYHYGTMINSAQWDYFNITDLVKKWMGNELNKNAGFILVSGNETIKKAFFSSEFSTTANRPYVVFTYKPEYNYKYKENAAVQYTYRLTENYTAGQTVIFETKKATSYADSDTVIHFFKTSDITTSTSWGDDDGSATGNYSKLQVTIPSSGKYTLLVRTFGNTHGYCNVYKNNGIIKENAKLCGCKLSTISTKTNNQNYFTAHCNGVDPILYVMDSNNRVLAYNDDYTYQNETQTGDFSWGRNSRIHKSYIPNYYVYVCGYSEGASGTVDIYASCDDGYIQDMTDFPSLKSIDFIRSAEYSPNYNCFAWSGGIFYRNIFSFDNITNLEPWYDRNEITAMDNYYGNNPLRYAGATTYVNTTNSSESVIDVYKNGNEWTHASVKKPGNDMPHGYDWESKLGDDIRAFHPRYSLTGGSYGNISRYYKLASSKKTDNGSVEFSNNEISDYTLQQSIENGLTEMYEVKISQDTKEKVEKQIKLIKESSKEEFDILYDNWVKDVKNDSRLRYLSTLSIYVEKDSFKFLKKYVDDNNLLLYMVVNRYIIDGGDMFSKVLFDECCLKYNDKTISLADMIREKNNEISRNTLSGEVYLAPSYEANTNDFINHFISDFDYYVTEK